MIDSTGFDVWYDVVAAPFRPNWPALTSAILIVIGFATAGVSTRSRLWSVLGPLGAALVLALGVWGLWRDSDEHNPLQSSVQRGEFTVVEGPVENFTYGRHDCREVSFRVEERDFNFRTCNVVSGFNGAGMRDLTGTCVKIALVHVPVLNADRVAWFGVRQDGRCGDSDDKA